MEPISLPIYSTQGKEVDTLTLNSSVFNGVINLAAMHQAVTAYLANQRKGLASTKTMGEVSGGGRKPWRQKGTGRARVGSIRSPLWRHGGVVFGPHPRNFHYALAQKIKDLALKSALSAKLKENNFIILENFQLPNPKTKEAINVLSNLKLTAQKNQRQQKVLLLLEKIDKGVKHSLRNIGFLDFNLAKDTNVYEVLAHHKLLITKEGLLELTKRLKA